jgi:hypothetical protein
MHRRELSSRGKQEALQQRRCALVKRNTVMSQLQEEPGGITDREVMSAFLMKE